MSAKGYSIYGIILLLTLLALSSGQAWARTAADVEAEATLQNVDKWLNVGENQQARSALEKLSVSPDNKAEKLWRMARLQYETGRLLDDSQQAFAAYQQAERFARQAISAASESSAGFKWLAIALGAQSKTVATETQVRLSREIKNNIEKALALNPQDDISYLVLSRWHYKVSLLGFFPRMIARMVYGGLPKASMEEAESLIWRAIELHDRVSHRYNLAKIYKRMGRTDEALTQLRKALTLPVTFPEESKEREKAQERLEKWR